jgi:hypothetical protein
MSLSKTIPAAASDQGGEVAPSTAKGVASREVSAGGSREASPAASREERLAQRLRENLRRRKAQARALSATEGASEAAPDDKGDVA